MRKRKERAGEVVGRLTILTRASHTKTGKSAWHCRCVCGVEKVVASECLRIGGTTSCGCLQRDRTASSARTHGKRKHYLYNTWAAMHQRCKNSKCRRYVDYGGRGITVCARWDGPCGFDSFLVDMGDRPSDTHSIERNKNDEGYSPSNCRWATRAEQAVNQRSSVKVTTQLGEFKTLKEAAAAHGISVNAVQLRRWRGWELVRSVITPVAGAKPGRI